MVKLLRLTTENNLKFEADLDAGIDIKANSCIALQNLTFESSDFSALQVNNGNNDISFSLDRDANVPPFNFISAELTNSNYSKSSIIQLFKDIEATLNSCLQINTSAGTVTGDAYSSFKVLFPGDNNYYGEVEKVVIIFKLTPMIMAFNVMETGARRSWDTIGDPTAEPALWSVALIGGGIPNRQPILVFDQDTSDGGINLGNVRAANGTIQHNIYNKYAFSDFPLSAGSAMYMVRIQNLIDNTLAKDTNGFSVGLALTDLNEIGSVIDDNANIFPDSLKSFEIRVSRPLDPYETIISAVTTVTATSPYSYLTATGKANDHILFEKNGTELIISVLQSSAAGGVKIPLITQTLTKEEMKKNIFPYLCIFGTDSNAIIGHPIFTPDAIINPLELDPISPSNDNMEITGEYQGVLRGDNAYVNISSDFGDVVPSLNDDLFQDNDTLEEYNPTLKMNGSILRAMGYDESTFPNNTNYTIQKPATQLSLDNDFVAQFNLIADGLTVLTNSDNYIVVLDSNPLYSYDASKFDYSNMITIPNDKKSKRGRRLNILATIPVNDNNGFVEFNSNELVYIDFDNKFPQTIKNIRLRVLDKNFDEIETNGESVMTLLIKDA